MMFKRARNTSTLQVFRIVLSFAHDWVVLCLRCEARDLHVGSFDVSQPEEERKILSNIERRSSDSTRR